MGIIVKKGTTEITIDVLTVEDYITKIIKETPGVAKVGGSIIAPDTVKRNFKNILHGNAQGVQGVKVSLSDSNKLDILVDIVILDSVNVIAISENIQDEITYLLKNKFSIEDEKINNINVNIKGIKIIK